jgi:hypothetical protein
LTATLLEKLYHHFVSKHSLSSEELKDISWGRCKENGMFNVASVAIQSARIFVPSKTDAAVELADFVTVSDSERIATPALFEFREMNLGCKMGQQRVN